MKELLQQIPQGVYLILSACTVAAIILTIISRRLMKILTEEQKER